MKYLISVFSVYTKLETLSKYWSLGALAAMIGTFYTGYKNMKSAHKYFACSSLLCMIMAIYSGHKMISGKSRKKKNSVSKESAE